MKLFGNVILFIATNLYAFSLNAQQWNGASNTTASIYRTGRVGIGSSTSPAQRLEVKNGNILLDYGNAGLNGNLYFGGLTDQSQNGLRLNYNQNFGGFLDVRTSSLNHGLIFRVDNNIGGTERMRINADGNVGIANTSPLFKLDVSGNGRFSTTLEVQGKVAFSPSKLSVLSPDFQSAIAAWSLKGKGGYFEGLPNGIIGIAGAHTSGPPFPTEAIGVWGIGGPLGSDKAVGVHGDATNGSKYAIGVWGQAMGGSVDSRAIWGDLLSGPGYAGYFSGDVFTTTLYLPSDAILKTNLQPFSKAIESLNKLNVYQFNFNTAKFPTLRLSSKKQYGLIADEVEKVFPELIKDATQPNDMDSTGRIVHEAVSFKCVNYEALIPILIQSVKEQQQEIELLKQEIAILKDSSKKEKRN